MRVFLRMSFSVEAASPTCLNWVPAPGSVTKSRAASRIDVPDRDHARGRGDDDHGQHQEEAAEGELADGERECSLFLRGRRQFGGHWGF
jgi:hypothetical protein